MTQEVIDIYGGRDRDRTCDPFHVNYVPSSELAEIAEQSGRGLGRFGRQVPFPFTVLGRAEPKSTYLVSDGWTLPDAIRIGTLLSDGGRV